MSVLNGRSVRLRAEPAAVVRPWSIAAAFGLVGTAVSAAGSWIPSLWGDEAATLLSAQRPVPSLTQMLFHVDAVHGFYYLIMHGWIRLVGDSPFALRLPSAIAVGLAIAAITLLAGRRGGPTAAITAGIVGCVLPRLTYAGEEARSFAFTAAAASWLTLLLVWLIDGSGRDAPARVRRTCWTLYGVGMAVTSYLFIYFASLALAHLGILLFARVSRPVLRAWALAAGCALLSVTPLAVLAYLERTQIAYLAGSPDGSGTVLYLPWFGTPWVAVPAWVCILVALGSAWRGWRRAGGGRVPVSATLVAALWLVLPTGALLAVNAVFPMYTARYSTFAAPAAAILIAEGILVLGRLVARRTPTPLMTATGIGVLAFVTVCTPVYLSQRGPYAKNDSDWSEVSAAVGAHAKPGDAVVFDEGARPSRRPRLAMHAYPAGFAAVRDVTLEIPYDRNIGWADRAYSVPSAAAEGRFDDVHRVWLIEDNLDGNLHRYGLAELKTLGFAETGLRIPTHRTMLIELTR